MVLLSFVVFVLLPMAAVAYYLWEVAEDQFASTVGFSVRREEVNSAVELFGGITDLSGSSSSDTDILFQFLSGQKIVTSIDSNLDLRAIWSKPQYDPVFAFDPDGKIEDLVDHWQRMVRVSYDSSSKLLEIKVLAFAPLDAQAIAQAIFEESTEMINRLSAIAREDSVRYARDELVTSVERLKSAREAVTRFRNEHQIVDPSVDMETQAGLLGNLQTQLAEALISLDLLSETTRDNDPRLDQARRKVDVIKGRIESEKSKLGISGGDIRETDALATVFGEYERLVVDREFAEQTYISALSAFDAAQAEAGRKSRYLAAHIEPTLAEQALYPRRIMLLGLTSLFLVLIWSISVLVAFSLKDRR
ncbi:hypothetical protein [Roseovarius rhodophyticola]|uniref:Sugar transporter n=1 Tax=Roseovarius rhodophyticola TaxID=3080827 RepID=A0ABZ2TIG4_9RHOB|nr:hypothetical protein [Roseovarius sp. W115]MDV2929816.1 hypothetical protein [Roseovarius sp. W115]